MADSTTGLRYLLVLDFEATCEKGTQLKPQEIIEFPIVVVDLESKEVLETPSFHEYVRPVFHPKLTAFCTELTGIQQATVDAADPFTSVFARVKKWIEENKFTPENSVVVTVKEKKLFYFIFFYFIFYLFFFFYFLVYQCGHWDLRSMLPRQLTTSKIKDRIPLLKRWINIKEIGRA